MIQNSRQIRKLLSGHLDAPLTGYPPLYHIPQRPAPPAPGSVAAGDEEAAAQAAAAASDFADYQKFNTEKYLLRAQLARISAATVVAPANAWEKKGTYCSFVVFLVA
jgi:hypothetical protein